MSLYSSRSVLERDRRFGSARALEAGFKSEPQFGKTVQDSAEEADINTIVQRFGLTGKLPTNVRVPLSGDFTDAVDFRSAMDAIVLAERSFAAMPADVRKRFGNDPAEFVGFTTAVDSSGKLKNLEEMRKMGLAVPAPAAIIEPDPVRVRVVTE